MSKPAPSTYELGFAAGWADCRDGALAAEAIQYWLARSWGGCGPGMHCGECENFGRQQWEDWECHLCGQTVPVEDP